MRKHIVAAVAALILSGAAMAEIVPAQLTCEYMSSPVGIDEAKPRMGWEIGEKSVVSSQKSEAEQSEIGTLKSEIPRGVRQTAYQVLVASSEEVLKKDAGDLWDSGKVESDQSHQVEYAGKPLESRQRCYWKVRVWTVAGLGGSEVHGSAVRGSEWSRPACWTMGLLKADDWTAKWIKPEVGLPGKNGFNNGSWIWFQSAAPVDQIPQGTVYLRARMTLPEGVGIKRAFVAMTADNGFTLFVNGQEALKGDDWKTSQGADLTRRLKAGENIIAVAATNTVCGWAGLIGRVTVDLDDGRNVMLDTGSSWKALDREQAGWQQAGFDDAGWLAAREIAKFGSEPWGANLKIVTAPWLPPGPENPPAPWVRKVFTLTAAPERAVAYVNVLGYYELYVNGQKVGDEVLAPPVSDLSRRSFYRTYDISQLLRPGRNCVGLWLDSGWRHGAGPIARVQIETSDGVAPVVVGSDHSWACAPSTHSLLGKWAWGDFGGECIDARREIAGWCEPEGAGGEWVSVKEIPAPAGVVSAQTCPPTHIGKVLPMAACKAMGTNTWELDFGTDLTGWMRIRLPALEPGGRVVMHYADKRFQTPQGDDTPSGKIGVTSPQRFKTPKGEVCYQGFNQRDEFISAGKTGEWFCSKFNYHGFRYVIVEGLSGQPAPGDAEALLVETDLEQAGTFECSNDLFNRIHRANVWTIRCLDLGGYMVDCPHRERLGYGDGQVGLESLVMNRDVAAFYGKWAVDWMDAQNPSTGEIPHTAPKYGAGGGPGWGGAGCVLPWKLYLYYGDRRLLERGYEPARRYVEWLEGKCVAGVMRSFGGQWDFIGDWVPPGRGMDTNKWPPKPAAELFNNCYLLYLMDQLARVAELLGRKDEAQAWKTKISERRPLIHAAFYDGQQQLYVLDEQAYQLMPLMTGLVPDALRETVSRKLEDLILVKNKGHLDTGMLGTYFLVQYLQNGGRNDLLYTIFNQETHPGWGYMLSQGATTFWEQWNGHWSQIHSCFTSPGGWFYQGLAGIRPDESAPGFKKIVIKPAIVGDLKWVNSSYDSIHGRIFSNWKVDGSRLMMDVRIPVNTTATVYVPARDAAGVTESGKSIDKVGGVKFLRMEGGAAVYEVGSGAYRFLSVLPEKMHGESK